MARIASSNTIQIKTALIAAVDRLRVREKRLEKLYGKLGSQPQLRRRFLLELAELRDHAERLDAVLDVPCRYGALTEQIGSIPAA